MELLWNNIMPAEYSNGLKFIAQVWREGGKSSAEHNHAEFVLSYQLA